MKKLILLILLISLISFSAAQQEHLGTFKQGDCVDLKQSCASCTYVNFTQIILPNGSNTLENVQAQQTGSMFNYTFCNTSHTGDYLVFGIGDVDATDTVFAYDFEITPSGTKFTDALSIPLLIPIGIMLLVSFFLFFIGGFSKKAEYKFTFLIFGGIFLIFSVAFGIIASRDVLYGFPLIYGFINSFYKIFIIGVTWGSIISVVVLMFFVIKRAFDSRGYNLG